MMVLIDLAYLQSLWEPKERKACALQIQDQINKLEQQHVYPQFLLRVSSSGDTIAAKKIIRDQYPSAQFHFLAIEDIDQSLQGDAIAHFLQSRAVTHLLSSQSNHPFVHFKNSEIWEKWPPRISLAYDIDQLIKLLDEKQNGQYRHLPTPSIEKPYLAIVSPYPPQKTGVADYVEQLLPYLQEHYIPILVVDNLTENAKPKQFPGDVLTASEFLQQPHLHQRVVYQIGNSPAHLYGMDLLKSIPGLVVLHDFYLGNALAYEQFDLHREHVYIESLIESHGTQALLDLKIHGLEYCINHYPCSLGVFQNAKRIGVHTHYTAQLASKWYGALPDGLVCTIPFPKPIQGSAGIQAKEAACLRLGLPNDVFLVASLGFGTPSKLHDQVILAWLESDLAKEDNSYLVFVGEYSNNIYLDEIKLLVPKQYQDRIRFSGFTSRTDYLDYLSITKIAVQLRDQSRGETSAAIMDCLASHVPVIANYLGSVIELPEKSVWKIGNLAIASELVSALNTLHSNADIRLHLSDAGYSYIEEHHQPALTALSYRNAIEEILTPTTEVSQTNLSLHSPRLGQPRLFLDISDTAKEDKRTGVQRVVRSLLAEWLRNPPAQVRIYPICADPSGGYRSEYDYIFKEFDIQLPCPPNTPINAMPGDYYLGLDLNLITVVDNIELLKTWRQQGVEISHILHDLLPIQRPDWFLPFVEYLFNRWLTAISINSDKILTVSATVQNELLDYLNHIPESDSLTLPEVGWFHHGCDLSASLPTHGMREGDVSLLHHMKSLPSFLMVSTIEPRKGYTQTVDAFDLLWEKGLKINLVIVGKAGWYVDELIERIKNHPQLGKHLFWVHGISDELLNHLYKNAQALICASFAEGFGLPIIEAAHHQTPVIARDIKVFREVGHDGVDYFDVNSAYDLAIFIEQWLKLAPSQRASCRNIPLQTWAQSAQQAQRFLLGPVRH